MTRINFYIISFLLLLLISIGTTEAQTTLYSQPFGGDTLPGLPYGWSNTGSLNWTVDVNQPSYGYPGASGNKNAFSGIGNGNAVLITNDISTLNYNNVTVLWGARKDPTQGNITFEYRVNGGSWTPVTFTDVNPDGVWALVNGGTRISLPGAGGANTLQFRWSLTNPVNYRIDDFSVQGMLNIGPPVKLVITSLNNQNILDSLGCIRKNMPFNVTVQSQDVNGLPSNVTSSTGIMLSVFAGTGNLDPAHLTGTISNGSNTETITDVSYNVAESGVVLRVTPFSGMTSLTPGNSNPFEVGEPATQLSYADITFPFNGNTNNILPLFRVQGRKPDNSVDQCFSGTVTLSEVSGPSNGLQGTLVQIANGSATFSNVYFNQPGTYVIKATSPGLTDAVSGNIVITNGTPALTEILLPQYIQGQSGTNVTRMMYVYLAELTNLEVNKTYRYYNQVLLSSEPNTAVPSGNVIFVNTTGGSFVQTSSPDLSTSGHYGEFTTNYLGVYKGWFMTEPAADSRFALGNHLKMVIKLNDGNNGTAVTTTLATSNTNFVKVINFGASGLNGAAALFATSGDMTLIPKNVIMLYDNYDSTAGSDRPVSGTIIEADGLNLGTVGSYFAPYVTIIDEVARYYGAIIPSGIPAGIIRMEQRSLIGGNYSTEMTASATGDIISVATSPNGIWPPGVDTRNVTSSITPLVIQPAFFIISVINENTSIPEGFKLRQNYPNPFNPSTTIRFDIPKSSFTKLSIYDVLGREVAILVNEDLKAGTYSVELNVSNMPSGVYFYRLTADDFSEVRKMVLIK